MSDIVNNSFNYNTFLKNIKLDKNFLSKLQNQTSKFCQDLESTKYSKFVLNVSYIIYIIQNRTNIVMHITDSQGSLHFSATASSVGFRGKAKRKAQSSIIKEFIKVLISSQELTYLDLENSSIALHLTNINSITEWIIKELKEQFFIESVQSFTKVPFNGCRKKKLRRKKTRVKKKKSTRRSGRVV